MSQLHSENYMLWQAKIGELLQMIRDCNMDGPENLFLDMTTMIWRRREDKKDVRLPENGLPLKFLDATLEMPALTLEEFDSMYSVMVKSYATSVARTKDSCPFPIRMQKGGLTLAEEFKAKDRYVARLAISLFLYCIKGNHLLQVEINPKWFFLRLPSGLAVKTDWVF